MRTPARDVLFAIGVYVNVEHVVASTQGSRLIRPLSNVRVVVKIMLLVLMPITVLNYGEYLSDQ